MANRRWALAILVCGVLTACGTGKSSLHDSAALALGAGAPAAPANSEATNAWPATLPRDGVQPWESLDAAGHVQPAAARSASAAGQGVFLQGSAVFSTGGTVTPLGDASHLASGTAGSMQLSFALYRLTLGGDQPGLVSLDANPNLSDSYYVGLSDYATNKWEWHGPYSTNHLRLVKTQGQLASSDYLSDLGNLFVCVAAYNGASADVVGVQANPVTDGDAAVPAAPANFSIKPVLGGLLLEWTPEPFADFAGYVVRWSSSGFSSAADPGVSTFGAAVDGPQLLLLLPPHLTFVAVQAVDLAGNASPLTPVLNNVAQPGVAPALVVSTDAPTVGLGIPTTVHASGAKTFDFDMQADGVYETSANTTGIGTVDTSSTGMHRINVRGHGSNQHAVALRGLSLLVTGNTDPTAQADADLKSGTAPLTVHFTGVADDAEDPPAALNFAWDFDGDGLYESGTNTLTPQHTYSKAGQFDATLQVTDSQGATATASVTIDVARGPNNAPTASYTITPQQDTKPMRLSYNFDAGASTDPDDDPLSAYFNYDNTTFEGPYLITQVINHVYPSVGTYSTALQVQDSLAAQAISSQILYVPSACNGFYGAPGTYTRQSPLKGAQSSHIRWLYRTGNYIFGTPVIGPLGTIYVGSADSKLYALTDNGTSTPTIKWRFTAGDAITSSPVVGADGTVYVGCNDHVFYALEDIGTSAAKIKWSFTTGDAVKSSPTLGPDGTVYIASNDYTVYALVDNGTDTPDVKWSYTTGSAIDSSPALGPDGTVYVGSYDRLLYALKDNGTATPDVKWTFFSPNAILSSPAIGPDGTVYIGSFDNSLYALTDNGTPVPDVKWSYATGGAIYSSPAVGSDGTVYIGSEDGNVYALTDNGTPTPDVKWTFTTEGPILASSPTLGSDGMVYIGSSDKKVYALKDNGTPTPATIWTYTTGDVVFGSVAIGPGGIVYVGSEDNRIFAFDNGV
jgi:outer membrane protein assembly factor BamB/PKD repeat protein